MANYTYTSFTIKGNPDDLERLNTALQTLGKRDCFQLLDTHYGPNWLGNLVILLGGNPDEILARGSICDHQYVQDDGQPYVLICTETAFTEFDEIMGLIKGYCPSARIAYFAELDEEGQSWTNDTELYNQNRYLLDAIIETDDLDIERDYYATLQEIIDKLNTGLKLNTPLSIDGKTEKEAMRLIEDFIDEWTEDHPDDWMSFRETELVEN